MVAENYPLNVSVMDTLQNQYSNNLTLLPEIKGPIKSVRMLLMQDLEADGVIKRNIPFSSNQGSKDRNLPRLSNMPSAIQSLKMSPSLSSIQTTKSIILNNPFGSKHRSLAPPSMRDSTT